MCFHACRVRLSTGGLQSLSLLDVSKTTGQSGAEAFGWTLNPKLTLNPDTTGDQKLLKVLGLGVHKNYWITGAAAGLLGFRVEDSGITQCPNPTPALKRTPFKTELLLRAPVTSVWIFLADTVI